MWNREPLGLSTSEKKKTFCERYKYVLEKALQRERCRSGVKAFGHQCRLTNTHTHKIRHTDSKRLKVEEVRQTEKQ